MTLGADLLHDLWSKELIKQMDPNAINQILQGYNPPMASKPAESQKAVTPTIANLRVETIENGYIVVYSKPGVVEKRKYAKGLEEVGEVTKQACIELQLQGK